jgi:hypothetical protein
MIEVKAYKCEYCNKTIIEKNKMEKHEISCIKKPEENCDKCQPQMKTKCALSGVKQCIIKIK